MICSMQAHILVIDDDSHVRFVLAKYIRRLGHTVYEAACGEDALAILSDKHSPTIDLIITDIWMPQMSGLEVLQAVRHMNPELPVAIITGAATLDTSIAAINAGAFAYLTKPIQGNQVKDVISRGLLKRAEQEGSPTSQQELLTRYQQLEQDIERLQERQHEMQHSSTADMLAELIRGLRHELGNATTAIKLNLSVLEDSGSAASLQEHLRDLQQSTDHLVLLLAKLREYPKHSLSTELVDLRQILTQVGDLVHTGLDQQKLRVNYSLPRYEILIQGAPLDLSRAFMHILENAVEAGEKTGDMRIEVSAKLVDGGVTVTISDNGPGFPDVVLEQPFSPGYTTKTTEGVVRGLGFGLFIARAVIELHEGRIWLENRPSGGADVHVQLPLAHVDESMPREKH
jgi:signal transduction histidine kinase